VFKKERIIMKIERINKGSWGKIRAFFDIRTEEGFVVKGFKIIEGINGLFVGFPSQKGQDDEYYDTVFAEKELKDELSQLAINEYGNEVLPPQEVNNQQSGFSENSNTQNNIASDSIESVEPFSEDDIPF